VESTLSDIPDAEPHYFQGSIQIFCDQKQVGLRLLNYAVNHNFCVYQALQTDPLLAKLRASPEFPPLLSAAKSCQERFLAETKSN